MNHDSVIYVTEKLIYVSGLVKCVTIDYTLGVSDLYTELFEKRGKLKGQVVTSLTSFSNRSLQSSY
jgi:hypothetical protein